MKIDRNVSKSCCLNTSEPFSISTDKLRMTNQQESSDDVAVDVLIVGAGPAGYMAGVTLARYGVSFRLIDQRTECIQSGQAGGGFLTSFVALHVWD